MIFQTTLINKDYADYDVGKTMRQQYADLSEVFPTVSLGQYL